MNNTDLINPYRPQYEEGICASTLACEEFSHYLEHPELYKPYFSMKSSRKSSRHEDLKTVWESRARHTCKLFEGKYSSVFFDFCIKNRIATPCDEGIQLPQDLAFIYMSFLADIISKNNELEMFTDVSKYNTLLLKNDKIMSAASNMQLSLVKNNIELLIPQGLKDIPLRSIIELRNQSGFTQSRKAYMQEVGKLIEAKEVRMYNYSHKELLSRQSDFIGLCGKSFDMIASTTVFIASILPTTNGSISNFDFATAIAASFNELRSINSTFRELPDFISGLKNKHLARKYVATINNLNIGMSKTHQK